MFLVIQIPCLNEEKTLAQTLKDLPKSLPGVDRIEVQIINDGSTDQTETVAKQNGVHHIIRFTHRKGLAAAFRAGMENALKLGADVLVNTDADNQYQGKYIADLVRPISLGVADIVVGQRPIIDHPEFSWLKKKLQLLGSYVLRLASQTDVKDAASGFRAYSQKALIELSIFSSFSYTLETLIQAGHQNLKILSVPIQINRKTRESRLFRNMPHYLWNSTRTIAKVFLIYKSPATFSLLALTALGIGAALAARYGYMIGYENAPRTAFWPSVILSGALLIMSLQFYLTSILSELISSNRKLLEEVVGRLRRLELDSISKNDTHSNKRAA